jgi:V/A-type H+-transporting ATPase subunit E
MEDKLQVLTEKIYSEGVTKANEEASKIIDDAKKEAESIVEQKI